MTTKVYEIREGGSPVVLSIPHTGDFIPDDVLDRFTEHGRSRIDTDWHVHKLYKNLLPDATVIRAQFHRYVIDANRDPAGKSLYSNRNETTLCPMYTFDGQPIYITGKEPDEDEIAERTREFHRPYHVAIERALERIHQEHGIAILYDCHSIRSEVPNLFKSTLPDLNIGTYDGSSCDRKLEEIVHQICNANPLYSTILNGIFRGGWTTRHYGNPERGIHAIQMELAQSTYMIENPPWTMDDNKTQTLCTLLAQILNALEQAAYSFTPQTCSNPT